MLIRKIKEEDLKDLQRVYLDLYEEKEGDLEKMRKTFKEMDHNNDYYLLGAEVDGKIVGSIMAIVCYDLVGPYTSFMTVENVVVLEAYRGKGVCKNLFEKAEEIAHERNCAYIYLVSGEARKTAHMTYHKLGYRSDNVLGFRKYLK